MTRLHKVPVIVGLFGLLACAVLLELAVNFGWVMEIIVPRPTDTVLSFPSLQEDMDLVGNFFVTLGMTAASDGACPADRAAIRLFPVRREAYGVAYEGWLAAAFSTPIVLLYPLFLVIFGRNHMTLIVMGCIPGAIPIAIQTRQGLLGVSKTLLNVGRSFNVSERDMFRKIMLPSAVPTIFTGIRIGVMYTLVNIVAIEYLIDFGGLGRIVSQMYDNFSIPETYAAIVAVILVSTFFYWGFGRVEKWLRPV